VEPFELALFRVSPEHIAKRDLLTEAIEILVLFVFALIRSMFVELKSICEGEVFLVRRVLVGRKDVC
jgi:hypothetical protein